jgi:hypothetical protein
MGGAIGISAISIPINTLGLAYQSPSPGLTSGVNVESIKLYSLSINGNAITSPIQVITISGTKYVVFSPYNACTDIPTDIADV